MYIAIPENQWQRVHALAVEQAFTVDSDKGERLLTQVVAFDLDAVLAELREHGGEVDEIRIDIGAADAGRAAHRWIIHLDGFHGDVTLLGCFAK
jgi:hypothetical protein